MDFKKKTKQRHLVHIVDKWASYAHVKADRNKKLNSIIALKNQEVKMDCLQGFRVVMQ